MTIPPLLKINVPMGSSKTLNSDIVEKNGEKTSSNFCRPKVKEGFDGQLRLYAQNSFWVHHKMYGF